MSKFRPRNSGWSELTRGAPLAVFVATGLLILYHLIPVLELVAVAILLALVMRTTLQWLQKFVVIRWVAVMILVAIIAGFGLFVAFVLVPSLIEETQTLAKLLPRYLNSLIESSRRLHKTASFIPDLSLGLEQLKSLVYHTVSFIPGLLRNTFSVSIQALATAILALYMAYDPDALTRGILRLSPRQQHWRIRKILQATKVRLRGWVFGTGLAMLIIGVGAVIGLWILRIPLALSLGILAGILEVIPYVGPIVGTVLPLLVALTISPTQALLVLVFFLILNQVEVHVVQPIVMGQRVGLHPVVVILAFMFLGELLGLIGLLLAVPVAAVILTLVEEFTPQESLQEVSNPEDRHP